MIKGTPKHEYAVLDGYYHVLVTVTEGGKISLKLDDRGILEYFLYYMELELEGLCI